MKSEKYAFDQLNSEKADLINKAKNEEHMKTYKMYQDEQLFHIQHTDEDRKKVVKSQQLV